MGQPSQGASAEIEYNVQVKIHLDRIANVPKIMKLMNIFLKILISVRILRNQHYYRNDDILNIYLLNDICR